MNLDENTIIDLVEGKLDAETKIRVQEALKHDPDLNQIYLEQKLIHEALEFNRDQELKALFADTRLEQHTSSTQLIERPRRFRMPTVFAWAAALAILLVATFLITRGPSQAELFASYYSEPFLDINRSSQNEILSENFSAALALYAEEAYEAAGKAFSNVSKDDIRYEESQLLSIDCLIKDDRYSEALIKVKERLHANDLSPSGIQSLEWNGLLLAIMTGDEKQEDTFAAQIDSNPNHLYHFRMSELKKEK